MNRRHSGSFRITIITVLLCLLASGCTGSASSSSAQKTYPIRINEIMASNSSYPDENGNYYDWIELYNSSEADFSLNGYKLTDNQTTVKYSFPADALIPAGGYYTVYCSRTAGGAYAPFSISRAGNEKLQLLNPRGVIADSVVIPPMQENQSYGRDADGSFVIFGYATPGYENSADGYRVYSEAHRDTKSAVRISEFMTKNASFRLENAEYADWIELENTSDREVPLGGLYLTDDPSKMKYVFPEGTVIPAHGFIVVPCTGISGDPACAPFRLSSAGGEKILLISHTGVILDEVPTVPLSEDSSLALQPGGEWTVSVHPTPGFENSEAGYLQYAELKNTELGTLTLRFSEVLSSNTAGVMDADGDFPDWIELENYGTSSVFTGNLYLTDNAGNPDKWKLPDLDLAPGEFMLIFATGKDRVTDTELHANFSLSRHGETLLLSFEDGRTIDSVTVPELTDNRSTARNADGTWSVTSATTPGTENTDAGRVRTMATLYPKGDLIISEVMTGNTTLMKTNKTYYDWIEVKNNSSERIDLGSYTLCKDPKSDRKVQLPSVTLDPGKYCTLLCFGSKDEKNSARKSHGVVFSLNDKEDTLFLCDASGAVADRMFLTELPFQGSYGRLDNEEGFFYFAVPTPDKTNANGFRGVSAAPVPDTDSGIFRGSGPVRVSLTAAGTIRYTLDGSTPTENSPVYTGPLELTASTVLTAAAFEENKVASPSVRRSYFIDPQHSLPIVSLVTDPENLTGTEGILATKNRYDRSVERLAHFDLIDGDHTISVDCGLKLHGAGSRSRNIKKSFKLVFRNRYGTESPLYEDFFGEGNEHTYSLLIRAGDDMKRAYVRDQIVSYLACKAETEVLSMNTRYCVLYINNEYKGLYTIRDAFSPGFFSLWRGVSKDSVEVQRGYVVDGSDFAKLNNYAKKHDLRNQENYDYVAQRVCIDSLIDWCIFEAYTANHDIGVNVRYFRSTEYEDNRWHYALFDMDYGFDTPATFDYLMDSSNHGALPKKLFKNKTFQQRFFQRLKYLADNVLTPEAVAGRVDDIIREISSEVPADRLLYKRGSTWEGHLKRFMMFMNMDRITQLKESAATYMGITIEEAESYYHL